MQPDSITLSVDEGNDGVNPVNHVYNRFESYLNRSVYYGPNHSPSNKNTLAMYRTFAKSSGNFKGTTKSAFKITIDRTVPGIDGSDIVAPQIIEVSFSNPVGCTTAQSLLLRQVGLSLLDLDAVVGDLHYLGEM